MARRATGRARRTGAERGTAKATGAAQRSAKEPALQLQSVVGNRAMAQLISRIDDAAGQMHPGHHPHPEQRDRTERGYVIPGAPAPSREGGKQLPVQLRAEMERTFGTGLDNVRVHESEPMADDLGSLAFTVGNDIHFAPGHYQPHSGSGRKVIAHELTHVIQQRAARVRAPQGDGLPVNTDIALENEAERLGRHAAWRMPVHVRGAKTSVRRPVDVTAQANGSHPAPPAPFGG